MSERRMTERKSGEERREELINASLELLATHPLSELSTRQLAEHLGVSQPALFRYFETRSELLLAILLKARGALSGELKRALDAPDPESRLRLWLESILGFAEAHPGLPRLLFADLGDEEAQVRSALASLFTALLRLAEEFLRPLPACTQLNPEELRMMAHALLAGLQGALLQGLLLRDSGSAPAPREIVYSLLGLIQVHTPACAQTREAPPRRAFASVDARPLLASGQEPLEAILSTLDGLDELGLLELLVPFEPRPLLKLLERRGCPCLVEAFGEGEFRVFIRRSAQANLHDFRELPAPEPLEQVLLKTSLLAPDESLFALLPRLPKFLLPRLKERGLSYEISGGHDGIGLLRVSRDA